MAEAPLRGESTCASHSTLQHASRSFAQPFQPDTLTCYYPDFFPHKTPNGGVMRAFCYIKPLRGVLYKLFLAYPSFPGFLRRSGHIKHLTSQDKSDIIVLEHLFLSLNHHDAKPVVSISIHPYTGEFRHTLWPLPSLLWSVVHTKMGGRPRPPFSGSGECLLLLAARAQDHQHSTSLQTGLLFDMAYIL